MADQPVTENRDRYKYYLSIPTRWMDNDIYGHVNNVIYYSYFDTVINEYLIRSGVLDIHDGGVIGIAVETHCQFHKSLEFPDLIEAGLRVGKLGNSSVRYEIGLFKQGVDDPAATGHFVHVFVDRANMRPVPLPPATRAVLSKLTLDAAD
jgi:acyl-CoA thioester hydrolase